MRAKALFITFEGGEGAGKTTLIDSIARQLAASHYYVVKTREPGGTHLGEHVRTLLLHDHTDQPLSSYAELFLFLAARAQQLDEVIRPALEERKIVLCDRFNDSTIAYQGIARGLGLEQVAELCGLVCRETQPHLTFYLDIDPSLGLARAKREHSN
jgi:dTMP kinase